MLSWLCAVAWLAAILPFCPAPQAEVRFSGYIEGEYVSLAPREAGRIVEIAVARGERVEPGKVLVRMQDGDAVAAVAAARAELSRAKAELADLQSGKRPEEIAVTRAELAEAEAALAETERNLLRQQELFQRGATPQALLDEAMAARDRASARVEAIRKRIEVEALPARKSAISAAEARVEAQRAQLAEAEWRLEQRTLAAPVAGVVDTVLRRPGEMAGPEAPAVSLLPDENRVVRFFVAEALRAKIHVSQRVALACDGCPEGLEARVRYLAAEPEYTPPIIYSVESRQKLVYLVEATPIGAARGLAPGQIVDVTLVEEAGR